MKKQIIAVDIDDVLASSVENWVAYSNEQWGTRLKVDDYEEDWAKMWGVDQKEAKKRALQIYGSGIVKDFKRLESAEEVLKELSKNYDLVITTSRVQHLHKETLDWLNLHFEGIFKEVHLAGFFDREDISEGLSLTKADLCKSIGADFLIDDHPKHCIAASEAGIKSILFGDYSWNRNYKELPIGVTRAMNWHEVLEYFSGITEK